MKPGLGSRSSLALDELDDYLSSEESPEDCMQLSDLDGFLTGIAIGPELIQPSEWFPVIWGDEAPDFENAEMAEHILGTIIDRYNEILQRLAADPSQLDPLFWTSEDDVVIAGDWAEGFVDAMSLRLDDWKEMLDDEEAELLLIPILALISEDEVEASASRGPEDYLHYIEQAAALIPYCVIEIDAYWKTRRGPSPRRAGTLH